MWKEALERVKWFLTYMKWTNELSIFINNSPQTFDIHTVAIAVAIVPFQKADKHLCVALHRKVRIRLHPYTESMCGIASNKG